jgi:DNA oxidative demethylase
LIDLFDDIQAKKQSITKDAYLLPGFASGASEHLLLADLQAVIVTAPLRNMMTKMGYAMSAAMTNCGAHGWVSDKSGYRYDTHNPETGKLWPAMPASFLQLATSAAAECGFADFVPDACLINQYKMGASMGLHQDKNELDFTQPIVSVSLGIAAVFLFGGLNRRDKTIKIPLQHGDIVVWGGAARLNYHAIMPLQPNIHAVPAVDEMLNAYRYNLTFRKAA